MESCKTGGFGDVIGNGGKAADIGVIGGGNCFTFKLCLLLVVWIGSLGLIIGLILISLLLFVEWDDIKVLVKLVVVILVTILVVLEFIVQGIWDDLPAGDNWGPSNDNIIHNLNFFVLIYGFLFSI